MKNVIFVSLNVLLCGFLMGCDRNASGGRSTLTIQFPDVSQMKNLSSSQQKIHALSSTSSGGDENWSSVVPTGFSGSAPINCFAVYISGPETEMRRNTCGRHGDASMNRLVGVWKGGVSGNTSIELEVPSGKERVIGVFGFYAQSGACKDFTGSAEMDHSQLSKPYILGEVSKVEMSPGQVVSVEVPLVYDSEKWFETCSGPDFNQGGSNNSPSVPVLGDYGTGLDGDISLASGLHDVRNINTARGVPLITTSRVLELNPVSGSTTRLDLALKTSATLASRFVVGDEVILYAAASSGSTACGPNVFPGFRSQAIVESTTGAYLRVNVSDARFSTIPSAQVSSAAAGAGRDFCRLVLSRVPHINTLTFAAQSYMGYNAATFGTLSNEGADHEAGLFFIKVKNGIVMNGDASIDLVGRGFSGGDYGSSTQKNGQGIGGSEGNSPNGSPEMNGGGGYFSSLGPGGGGHGGQGGKGYTGTSGNGGLVVGDPYGCGPSAYDSAQKCLFGKIFMGGGGGAHYDAHGGAGGGLISLAVKTISLNSFTLSINTDGGSSYGGSTGGGGGGAGGAVLIGTSRLQGSAGGVLDLRSNGGVPMATAGQGGGGGGGRIHLNVADSCSLAAPGSIRMNTYGGPQMNASTGGYAGGLGTTYATGGSIAACGTIDMNTVPHLIKVDLSSVSSGSTVKLTGISLAGASAVQMVNSSGQQHSCTINSATASQVQFTVPSGVATGQYDVVVTSASGRKVKMPSALYVSP
ncbi:MAG: hypothetical protein AAGB31_02620 [Bdellovibrio sp.]